MRERVAEHHFHGGEGTLRVRVDLHGVSVVHPDGEREVLRWEWITDVDAGETVIVRSPRGDISLPHGAFGFDAEALADRLRRARTITDRPDVIGELAHR